MKIALSTLKFVSGSASNLICQSVRSLCNLLGCVVLSAAALALFLLAGLQLLGGGRVASGRTALKSWSYTKTSLKMFAFALLQAIGVVSLLGPLARGAQACTEGLMPGGIYAPKQPSNIWQVIFGLNSWHKDEDETHEPKDQQTQVEAPPQVRTAKPRAATPKMKVVRKTEQNKGWLDLSRRYLDARSREEMDAIRTVMAIRHPLLYMKTLSMAKKAIKRKKAA